MLLAQTLPNLVHILVEERISLQHAHVLLHLPSHRVVMQLLVPHDLPINRQHLLKASQLVRSPNQLRLLHHYIGQQLVLEHPFILVVAKRQEVYPERESWTRVKYRDVMLDDLSNRCHSVVSTVTVSFFLFGALGHLHRLIKSLKPVINGLLVENRRRSHGGKDSESIASSLPEDTTFFADVFDEYFREVYPMSLEKFISEELDHVINEKDSKLQHVLSLSFSEDLGEDIGDQEVGKTHGHGFVSLEEGSN